MKFLFLSLAFLPFTLFATLDTGSGALGNCSESIFSANQRTYECETLTISTNNNVFSSVSDASSIVIIKVKKNVTINAGATLSLNGESPIYPQLAGGKPGAGASAGGSSANNAIGIDGLGSGGGKKGLWINSDPSIGGGGGGASYNSTSIGEDGEDGQDNVTNVPNTKGIKGSSYNSANNFETNFTGGSGGGAGAGGYVGGTGVVGGAGGGGGGALRIIAGGDIVINGTIEANGGNGSVDPSIASGGGGGSGGAIWLQSLGNITGNGSVNANGGTGGKAGGGPQAGDGGNGGKGIIRFDDDDGIVTLSSSPNATVKVIENVIIDNNQSPRQYTSNVNTCSVILDENKPSYNFIFDLIIGFVLLIWVSKKHKKDYLKR